jgi:hypothetical protein
MPAWELSACTRKGPTRISSLRIARTQKACTILTGSLKTPTDLGPPLARMKEHCASSR